MSKKGTGNNIKNKITQKAKYQMTKNSNKLFEQRRNFIIISAQYTRKKPPRNCFSEKLRSHVEKI